MTERWVRARRSRAYRRRWAAGRPWWNGDRWSVVVYTRPGTWHWRDATVADFAAYARPTALSTTVDDVIVAGPAPARLALVRGDAA